jgi:hypothetical protein
MVYIPNLSNPTTVSSNPWNTNINSSETQISVRFRCFTGASSTEYYFIDDVKLTGTLSGGTPTKLAITSISPSSPTVGSTFSVTIQAQDASNIPSNVTSATDISLAKATGIGTLGGTTAGQIANGNNSVTISGVTYDAAETGVSLTAATTGGMSLTSATSSAFTVLAAAPTTASSSIVFGAQTTTEIPLTSWTVGNGTNRIVVRRAGGSATAPTNGTDYAVSSTLGTGTVIYNGSSNTVTASGLTTGTQYSFDIYEYNGSGVTANYGSVYTVSRYTLSTEPSSHSATLTATSLSSTTLTLNFTTTGTSGLGYIILRKDGASASTGTPVDGTSYAVGNTLGDGTVAAFITANSITTASITGLTEATQYTFSIIPFSRLSTNAETYNYYIAGSIPTLTKTTLATQPSTLSSNITVTSRTSNSISISWTNGNGAGRMVVARTTTATAATDGIVYTSQSNDFTDALNSTTAAGNIVVYNSTGLGNTLTVIGLSSSTNYKFDIYEYNGSGEATNYTSAATSATNIYTLNTEPITQATNVTFSNITANGMTINFTKGDAANTGRIVLVRAGGAVNSDPIDATTYTANSTFMSGTQVGTGNYVVYMGSGASVSITGLSFNTNYHVAVYEYNGSGSTFNCLTTSPATGSQITLVAAPSAPTDLTFGTVTYNSFIASFTAPVSIPSGYLVLRRTGTAVTGTPVGGTTYTQGNTIGNGNTIVYIGSAPWSNFDQTGLTDGTTYHYAVYSYDGTGTQINYSTALTGNQTTSAVSAPNATAANAISTTGFTANWDAGAGASGGYKLDVSANSAFAITNISENFTGCSAGSIATPDGTDISGSLDSYLQTTGWTGSKLYQAGGLIKLGTSSLPGEIITKTIDLSANSGNATLSFDFLQFGSDVISVQVFHASNGSSFVQIGSDLTPPVTLTTQNILITGGTANSKIKIATTNKRIYLDNLVIQQNMNITGYNDLAVNSGTSKAVTGLTANTTYYYRVRAVGGNSTSANSNVITATTSIYETEPTNHATTFAATANSTSAITTTWSDNDGAQAASGFLLMMNTSNTFTDPVDGVAQTDGANVKNINHGVQTYQWTGLTAGTQYFFKIFPYNGSGSTINYKTDGTVPTSNTYTNSTSVTVNSSTNWTSLTNVGTGTDVTIPNGVELTVNANANCAGITIENGGKLTINSSTILSTSALLIEDGGSLIDNGNNTLPALADKNIAGNASSPFWNWHFLSAPVANQAITGSGNFIEFTSPSVLNPDIDFYRFDPNAANPWINIKQGAPNAGQLNQSFDAAHPTDPEFTLGMGYLVAYNSTSTAKTFDGNLNTGNTNITVVANKFNLIGNPFPSAITWTGADYDLASDFVWIYNENKAGGAGYQSFDAGTIAPMQGFFVEANANTGISLLNSIRTHNASTFYKSSNANEFSLKFSNGANWDDAKISFDAGALNIKDRKDALKMFSMNSSVPQIYTTISTGQKFAVNALPTITTSTAVPVGILVPANGNYSITAEGMSNFSMCTAITLEDLKTNTTQNLLQNPVYNFTATTTDNANRFVLHFATSVGVNENGKTNTGIYAYDNNIYVNANEQIKQIAVYNTMGQLIETTNNVNGLQKISMNGHATGYYIVKVITDKNVYSEKVLVK